MVPRIHHREEVPLKGTLVDRQVYSDAASQGDPPQMLRERGVWQWEGHLEDTV